VSKPLIIDYYTDVLCVWAWISQVRIDELKRNWGDQVQFRYHYLNIFADTEARIGEGWRDKGGFEGFGQHVIESAAPYPDAPVNPKVWQTVRPKTSMNAHMLLKALEILDGAENAARYSVTLRKQFFVENQDIGDMSVLLELAHECGFQVDPLRSLLMNGEAGAKLAHDYQQAQQLQVKGSPSLIMNNGRQTLYGNVGYRVLEANISEFLKANDQNASWC
jgi:predicted DsbA family dithiol-disulfide isomerase